MKRMGVDARRAFFPKMVDIRRSSFGEGGCQLPEAGFWI
jgi:hypothetical protein